MSIGPVINLASGYIQSLFTRSVNGSSSTNTASTNTASTNTALASTVGNTRETNQSSSFAQILSSLQQLEQSNPSHYQQVTQQIASNLQTASQTATSAGNTALAGQLTQLSTDFKSASTSGQLPNVQDLAQAIGGGDHRHHHYGGSSSSSSAPSGSGSSATVGTPGNLSEFIQSLNAPQTRSNADSSLNAQSIIDNTLSSAGIQIG